MPTLAPRFVLPARLSTCLSPRAFAGTTEGDTGGLLDAAPHKMVNRSATPRPAPAAVSVQSVPAGRVQLQSAMRVSSPHDPAEREADATAKKILRMPAPEVAAASTGGSGAVMRRAQGGEGLGGAPGDKALHRTLESPYIARFAESIGLMQRRAAAPVIARRAEGPPEAGAAVAADIAGSRASGAPLPLGVRSFMEPRFRADFSNVRIHTGDKSAQLNRQVSAQAFTVGNHIFFGKGRFQPETHEGKELIAHELTHTIQQGAAVQQGAVAQRREDVAVMERAAPQVQRLGVSDALDYFADRANAIPGFRMFTIVLGVNPINMGRVDRSAANILRAVVEFLPGGVLITQALDNYGVFERVGGWVEQQLRSLGLTGGAIRDAINRFLDSLSWSDIFNLGGVWDRARRILAEPIDRIIGFARGLFGAILRFIKDAVLRPIAGLASRTRGWDLLCAVLGQDPITGDPVPRNAETLIGGFMKLIGQEEIWENIKRSNAVARAWAWFQGALTGLIGFVRQVPRLFLDALSSLEISDLVLLPRAFARVAGVFGDFIGSFLRWAGNTVWDLLEIIFSVVAPSVLVYLRRAAGAFRTILRNPIGFVGNLVRAGLLGLRQFAGNFLTHLRGSLIGWLTGAMSGANIYIPQGFSLREIIKFVLSVLGLTWQNLRQKLVRAIGETAVRVLETGFDVVATLVTQGPGAAWEKIQESLSNLRELVMEQIMTFVRDNVVQAAITRLVTSLNPAGAFIQAILAIYNTVMFFVERMRQIAQVAAAFIDSISAIANGVIAAAANRVEQTMGGLLTLVISFLARIAGLGRVTDAVTGVVNRVRQPIDRALDRVVEWIVAQARRLGRFVMNTARGGRGAATGDPQIRLRGAVAAAETLMEARGATTASVRQRLATIRDQFGLTALELRNPVGHDWIVVAQINPQLPSATKKIPSPEEHAAIVAQSAQIAQLWRINGVGPQFRGANRSRQRAILVDEDSYRRPGGVVNAPEIRVGDLVEAAAEPGLRQIAAATGSTLLVKPSLYLADAGGQPLGGRVDEMDFLLLGPAEVRVVSAKLQRHQFSRATDQSKLTLFQSVPDNPGAASYIANFMGWGDRARAGDRARTAGAVIQCAGMEPLRASVFRSRYLNRERTRNIIIEPVAPHGQGETPTSSGYSLRITLADLIDSYVNEIAGIL
ncbi:eCIS core domain-containing protein [Sorangium sp. So ce385]|uniref:eCIS core domain-containing protein n=1 Tax=Sorangium sp. So ce385 TaxID=3133308 RepID=UPI003F5B4C5A